jgi:hypothetical protein
VHISVRLLRAEAPSLEVWIPPTPPYPPLTKPHPLIRQPSQHQ